MIPQPTVPFRRPQPHLHVSNDLCPLCEQEIPADKLEAISGKIAAKEREQALAITARLEQQFIRDKSELEAQAKADIEAVRQESAAKEAAAREEARVAAEAASSEKLQAAELRRQELETQAEQAAADKKLAEDAKVELETRLQSQLESSAAALETAKNEAAAREQQVRAEAAEEARAAAEAASSEKLQAAELRRQELETQATQAAADKKLAEEAKAELESQLQAQALSSAAALELAKTEATAREEEIRAEAQKAALETSAQQIADATAKAADAEAKLTALTEQQEAAVAEQLSAQREILEKDKESAINAEKAAAFAETLKLSTKVNDLQRALEKKSNEELGEGAELDLFEALKAEFPDDLIERIAKGTAGADVIHTVRLNGRKCGSIIYDSKNHKAFRNDHVTKLRSDQLAAKAEHAILSTHKFPAGVHQLHRQDGVLLANPARVVAVATLIREHLVQTHALRLSGAERESKTAQLYAFIMSDHCAQLLDRVDSHAAELLEEQVKEQKQHKSHWEKEGQLIRSIQKAKADLSTQISGIIGTAAEPVLEESGA